MSTTGIVGNKFLPTNQSGQNSETVIASVSYCLAAHHECSGRYIDCFDKYTILCNCRCHKARVPKKGDRQVRTLSPVLMRECDES